MKKYERIISIILLYIVGLSNLATPAAYAAQAAVSKIPPPAKASSTPIAPPKFEQPDSGSVLGDSTSLFALGTQSSNEDGTLGSAGKRIPIRMQQLPKRVYQTDENVTLAVTNPDSDPFSTQVVNAKGQNVPVPITQTYNGTTTNVQIQGSNEIVPGTYTIKVTDNEGNVTTQDFSWGVLALNTDKSMYHPGDTADLSMAVLDDQGNMVCDAQLTLQITNQELGINDILSTNEASRSTEASASAQQITVNPQCQQHDFSLQPDYQAAYTFRKAGTYTMQLTATTQSGTHSITDTVPVTNDIPFDVQRVSATRIYPPNTYPMTFNITAHRDFSGTVTETVPQDFIITPATMSATPVNSYTNMQTVYLQGNNPAANLEQTIVASGSGGLVMPFHGYYPITQGFGAQMTDPTLQAFYTQYGLAGHDGVDFGVPMDTPLYAVDDGNVIWSGPGDYGITIIIQHSWGESYYGHLSTTAVNVGTHVTKGELIGYSGESGEATGPHLHFGMRPNNPDMTNGYYGKVDPLPYLPYNQTAQPISEIGPTISANPLALLNTSPTLGSASTSAGTSASGSAAITPSLTPTITASPSAAPVSESPAVTASPTEETQPTPTTGSGSTTTITESTTPPANTNIIVLDKDILANEQLANSSQTEKVKVITWHVTLKNGQSTSLGYDYQAPPQSPQFYLLGPMQFYQSGSDKVVFQEQRQWQIASDDVGVEWYNNNTGNTFNGYSWQYRKKIDISHTKVQSVTVTYDATGPNSSGAISANNVTTLSWNHTVSGSNTALLVGVGVGSNITVCSCDTGMSAAVTDNTTTNMTLLGTVHSANSNQGFLDVFGLLNAPTGSNTIAVTVSGGSGPPEIITGGSESFDNVGSFGTPVSAYSPPGGSGTASVTTSGSTVGNIIAGFVANGSPINSATAPSTSEFIADGDSNTAAGNSAGAISQSTGSNVTMSWSVSTDLWGAIAIEVKAASGTLSSFPVLVNLSSDSDLAAHAQSNGNDILFTDSTGESLLPFEIENYNNTTGALVAWVQISSLSSSTDTIIYMYFGNPSATSLANAPNVWDSNYIGVWHLGPTTPNGSTLSVKDSTINGNNGTNTNATYTASGQIDGAASLGGTANIATSVSSTANDLFATSGQSWSTEAWFNATNTGTIMIIGRSSGTGGTATYGLWLAAGSLKIVLRGTTTTIGSGYDNGSWHSVTITWNGTSAIAYVDGGAATSLGVGTATKQTDNICIGGTATCTTDEFNGTIDEVRVSNSARSQAWIITTYNNEGSPSSFYTEGSLETDIYAPTLSQILRHGQFFDTEGPQSGTIQPFTW